jgi:hypothetical protein
VLCWPVGYQLGTAYGSEFKAKIVSIDAFTRNMICGRTIWVSGGAGRNASWVLNQETTMNWQKDSKAVSICQFPPAQRVIAGKTSCVVGWASRHKSRVLNHPQHQDRYVDSELVAVLIGLGHPAQLLLLTMMGFPFILLSEGRSGSPWEPSKLSSFSLPIN